MAAATDTPGQHGTAGDLLLILRSLQTRTRRMAEQPPPAQHHQGRAMRYRVRHHTKAWEGSRAAAHGILAGAGADDPTEQRYARSLTAYFVSPARLYGHA
jgi:hypothetical protein